MDHITLKRAVLQAAKEHLSVTVNDLKERIQELKDATLGNDDSESASQRESTRGGDLDLMNSLGEQLRLLQQDLEQLDAIDASVRLEVVQYGAVVHTNLRNFLIAASIDEFEAGGRAYLGVSVKAPVTQALMTMSVGDQVDVNGVEYVVQDIC